MIEDAVICVGLQRSTALKITLCLAHFGRISSVIYPWLYFCFNSSEKSHNKKNVNTIFSIQLTNSVVSSLLLKYSGITYKYSQKSAILMNKLLGVCSFALVFQVENYQACFVDASLARRLLVFSCR